jgi:hypothetical protein
MAGNTHVSQAGWDAALNAITALANGGTVTIYDGAQPATPDVAVTSQNALVTMSLSATAAGSASAGTATMNAVTSAVAGHSSTATWFRVYASGGAAVWDGDVGTSGSDMNFSTTTFTSGVTYGVTSWTISMPVGQ